MTRRRLILVAVAMLFLVMAVAGTAVHWAASQIITPPRRPIEEFHRVLLHEQDGKCMRIEQFSASDGTPCLVAMPFGNPARRGLVLRDQMAQRGYQLPTYGQMIGSLVLVHGRKGRKEDYLAVAERFCAVGFRCIIPDLPGHGDHPKEQSTYGVREAALPALVLEEAAQRFQFGPRPSALLGLSMGGSVAVHAASLDPHRWSALVVVASFDELASSIQHQASRIAGENLAEAWVSATDGLIRHRAGISLNEIRPAHRAAVLTMPTMIVHGTSDDTVPVASARRLFNALPEHTKKQWIELPGADHDNVLITDYPLYATMASWMFDAMNHPRE